MVRKSIEQNQPDKFKKLETENKKLTEQVKILLEENTYLKTQLNPDLYEPSAPVEEAVAVEIIPPSIENNNTVISSVAIRKSHVKEKESFEDWTRRKNDVF
mgnify:CR=1 FL=1